MLPRERKSKTSISTTKNVYVQNPLQRLTINKGAFLNVCQLFNLKTNLLIQKPSSEADHKGAFLNCCLLLNLKTDLLVQNPPERLTTKVHF